MLYPSRPRTHGRLIIALVVASTLCAGLRVSEAGASKEAWGRLPGRPARVGLAQGKAVGRGAASVAKSKSEPHARPARGLKTEPHAAGKKVAAVVGPEVLPGRQPNHARQAEGAAKARHPVAEDAAVYVIEQTPAGEAVCRLPKASESEAFGGKARIPVRQINHLRGKQDAEAAASAGLTIILRGTARLEANQTAKQAFIAAAARWESLISSQIAVTIDVDFGPDFFGSSTPYGPNTLGATSMGGFLPSYSTVRQRLVQNAPAASEEATLLNNLPASSLPTDIGNVSTIFVPAAQALALGINIPPDTAIPSIGFNSNFTFDFDPTNGITSAQTDFDAVAVHEIGHALGFTSQVGVRELSPSNPLFASVWDIFRFRPGAGTAVTFSTAQRVLTSGASSTDAHVFFGGASETALSTGRPNGTGGDGRQPSHWKDDGFGVPFIGIMDPTIPSGRREEIQTNDLRAIDLFGYTLAGVTPPPPPPAPANDNFASAQSISGASGRVTGTNVGATKEAGEPSHSPDNDPGGKSVWYNWTAPSSGPVTFTTGAGASGEPASTFDTVLAAYTGAGVGALAAIAKNDDLNPGGATTSGITFNAASGSVYRIAVDGWNADEGSIALNWSFGGGTGGGDQLGCPTNPSPITVNGSTVNGSLASGDCANPADGSFYDAYTFTAPAGQLVIIEMTSTAFDTYLYLLRPGETALSYRTIQNDDTAADLNSRIVVALPGTGNTTYTILANSALSGATGAYQLSVFSTGNCAATNIGGGTVNGTLGAGDCQLHDGSFVDVYAFTATAGQQISIEQNSSAFDSFLFLLSNDGFTELARNDDGLTGGGTTNSARGARIPAPGEGAGAGLATLPADGTYYILANSFAAGETGAYTLALTLGANCPVQPIAAGATTTGQSLTTGDCRLPFDGSFMDVYTFDGTAGQQIAVTMTSTAFDSYLLLYDPAGFLVAEDNDGAGGTNARLPAVSGFLTLPVTGTYRIYANAVAPGLTGSYQLSVASADAGLRIDTVAPAAGRDTGGQQVVLTGSFDGLSSVSFGGSPAPFAFTGGTSQITVTTPAHAPGAVSVVLVGAAPGASHTKPNAFAYLPTTFTDNTLVAGVTTAKAQHVLELRQAVDSLRAVAGLQPAQWTDPALAPAATFIKAIHISELRARIEEAAAALGLAPAAYTDPGLGAGGVIKRAHIEELRQRVRNIAG